MDDFNLSTLIESKNEWCARLINILTPCIITGINDIFNEAYNMCIENDEESKYLMTFQNLLNNIPKWSSEIVDNEKNRIITQSCCNYIDDLLTCVHITQLKSLTSSRVGIKQKKINIDIPNLNIFIHKAYVNIARKIYVNIYLFEKDISPLLTQKNNRELEIIIKECILNTVRESIPLENILKSYLDETLETDVTVEESKEIIEDKEEIEKRKKSKEKEELEKIKKEVTEIKEKENDKNFKNLIKKTNEDLNKRIEHDNNTTSVESVNNDENEITDDNKSDILDNESTVSNDNLNIGDSINIDTELEIENLDHDIDKFDIDSINLSSKSKEDNNIELDIQKLE